jgi:hypothetical protein
MVLQASQQIRNQEEEVLPLCCENSKDTLSGLPAISSIKYSS